MEEQQRKNWFSRNWKWAVPTGCGGCLLLAAGFVAVIVLLVFGALKSSDVYAESVARASSHPAVQEALGTPIEEGMMVSGEINTSGASGDANISIPISGPEGDATIYAIATKSGGAWIYSQLVVKVEETGEMIDLLDESSAEPEVNLLDE